MTFPENLKYSKEHEWIKVEGDVATIGITAHAQDQLGDIVFVDVETEGETMEEGEVFGSIEAVKTVSDLFMPISGEIITFNNLLESEPEKINEDPYESGWIVKVNISDKSQLENLLDASGYTELVS
jgi:glycine cleavage system H protein